VVSLGSYAEVQSVKIFRFWFVLVFAVMENVYSKVLSSLTHLK